LNKFKERGLRAVSLKSFSKEHLNNSNHAAPPNVAGTVSSHPIGKPHHFLEPLNESFLLMRLKHFPQQISLRTGILKVDRRPLEARHEGEIRVKKVVS
jgi:hypothetical protein